MAGIIIKYFRSESSAIKISTEESCQLHYWFFSLFCAVTSIRKLTLGDRTNVSVCQKTDNVKFDSFCSHTSAPLKFRG